MTTMRQPTVLLADDHVVFTDGIVRILEDRFDVVGTVTDGGSMFEATCRLRPDVVVTDISMPRLSGLEGLRRLKAKHDDSRVIFLTMHADAKLAAEAFRLGARGFVLKQASGEELVKAIEAVLEGHKYMSAAITDDVLALMSAPASSPGVELTIPRLSWCATRSSTSWWPFDSSRRSASLDSHTAIVSPARSRGGWEMG